jgi:homotetrameric cytidine deaminase
MRNIELKARDPDPARTLERALAIGAEDIGEIRQRDTYFAGARGRLKLREQETDGPLLFDELIEYSRADSVDARTSTYRRVPVGDAAPLREALEAAYGADVTVTKRRRLLQWEGVRIHLDEVEGLGSYLEIEAVADPDSDLTAEHEKVERLREELGIGDADLVAMSYADLVRYASTPAEPWETVADAGGAAAGPGGAGAGPGGAGAGPGGAGAGPGGAGTGPGGAEAVGAAGAAAGAAGAAARTAGADGAEAAGADSAEELLLAAEAVMRTAHAKYSQFPVGAALRGADGRVYVGSNVENASYPQGQCAETSAIGALVAAGQKEITEVAVVAELADICPPCGGCRQRLAELAHPDTPVHLGRPGGPRRTTTVGELLPLAFDFEPPA